ncbi:MAG: DUF4954 family protein [Prolixibacteraceae bacterium]|nr:DUF4954 family protein [Prolixibacteraceae bacterium]
MYRNLTSPEINILEKQGNEAEDWRNVQVKDGFNAYAVKNTQFDGEVKLGVFTKKLEVEGDIVKKSGIFNSFISNCIIGDNTRISKVNILSNYIIGNNTVIENAGSVFVDKESTFGNGAEIDVLNEGGGRELPIFDQLSSQIASILVLHRHDTELIKKLKEIISNYTRQKKSDQGYIGSNVKIIDTTFIKNVFVDDFTVITGALNLNEGTIRSAEESPAVIGGGVIAKEFIVLSGSVIDSGAIITSSFIGQGVQIGKQYSAVGSAFFANSEAFHGEACSLFAGPYTVTHHKSSLLIAGMFSFYNAGSGSNQSNHMYKLGPNHQGIVERGSKTGSLSYMLWPCKVGPFSVVMGKHPGNFDASEFPFSYLNVVDGKSVLTPAMNLFTVGTRRDSVKWPKRDRRKDPVKYDLIHFDFLNPFIIERVVNASNLLNNLLEKTPREREYISYKGIHILRLMLRTTRKYYEMFIKLYIAEEIKKRIGDITSYSSFDKILAKLNPDVECAEGPWIDVGGMYAPDQILQEMLDDIKTGNLTTVDMLHKRFNEIFSNYKNFSWNWCAQLIEQRLNISVNSLGPENLIEIINEGLVNKIKLNNMILKDAEKEFDPNSKTGFGYLNDNNIKDADFESVRGTYEKNSFVNEILAESELKKAEVSVFTEHLKLFS